MNRLTVLYGHRKDPAEFDRYWQATIADVPNFATGGFTFMFDDEVVLIPCSLGAG